LSSKLSKIDVNPKYWDVQPTFVVVESEAADGGGKSKHGVFQQACQLYFPNSKIDRNVFRDKIGRFEGIRRVEGEEDSMVPGQSQLGLLYLFLLDPGVGDGDFFRLAKFGKQKTILIYRMTSFTVVIGGAE